MAEKPKKPARRTRSLDVQSDPPPLLLKPVYVLHAFMKKSKSGIGLPKPDAELIELRLKRAQSLDAEE